VPNTKTTRSQNPSPSDGQNPAITPLHEMPLSFAGEISPSLVLPEPERFVVSSGLCATPSAQDELDAWIAGGGVPEFQDTAS